MRLHSIRIYTQSKDPFFDAVPINIWSMVEVNLGILCASIPALKALFSRAQRERSQNGTYQYHSRERSGGKSYGKGSKGSSGGGSAGTVLQDEVYGLKAVRNGEQRPSVRKEVRGGGAWRASDLDVEEQRIVYPESRV